MRWQGAARTHARPLDGHPPTSKQTTPKLHQSTACVYPTALLRAAKSSGARYSGVPQKVRVRSSPLVLVEEEGK